MIACLALVDLRPAERRPIWIDGTSALDFDDRLERYARSDVTGAISVRRVDDDRELARLPGTGSHAWVFRFSADGRWLATVYHLNAETVVWDLKSRQPAFRVSPGTGAVAFRPDGLCVAIGNPDKALILYNTATGEALTRELDHPCSHLEFRPDGEQIAVGIGGREGGVEVRDAEATRVLWRDRRPAILTGLRWSPDGRHLAAAYGDERIVIYDRDGGGVPVVLERSLNHPTGLAFSPDGSLLASNGWDEMLRLWDVASGRLLLSRPGARGTVRFRPDGRLLGFTLDGADVQLWQVDGGRSYRTLRGGIESRSLALSPDGHLIATVDRSGVRLRDRASLAEVAVLPEANCRNVRFLPRGGGLLTCGSSGLRLWPIGPDPDGGADDLRIGPPRSLYPQAVLTDVALRADGQELAVVDQGARKVAILDRSGRTRAEVRDVANLESATLSPDGRWLAVGTRMTFQPGLRVWEVGKTTPPLTLPTEPDGTAAFSPDGRWLITSLPREFRFWHVGSWTPGPIVPRPHGGSLSGPLAFTADGSLLACAVGPSEVRLLNPADGRPLATLQAPDPERISELAFSADGAELAATAGGRFVQLWDLRLIRRDLKSMGLDWEWPPLPAAQVAPSPPHFRVDTRAQIPTDPPAPE